MKIEIEITEEDAACLWADNWGPKGERSLQEIAQDAVETVAARYRLAFPGSAEQAVKDYRANLKSKS